MNCTACSKNWTPSGKTEVICPVCGQIGQPETLYEGLLTVFASVTPLQLTHGEVLCSAFSDYAPDLKAERNLLHRLTEVDGHRKLMESSDDNTVRLVSRDLEEIHSVSPEKALEVCTVFRNAWHGLPGSAAVGSKPVDPPKPKPPVQEDPTPKKDKPEPDNPEPNKPKKKAGGWARPTSRQAGMLALSFAVVMTLLIEFMPAFPGTLPVYVPLHTSGAIYVLMLVSALLCYTLLGTPAGHKLCASSTLRQMDEWSGAEIVLHGASACVLLYQMSFWHYVHLVHFGSFIYMFSLGRLVVWLVLTLLVHHLSPLRRRFEALSASREKFWTMTVILFLLLVINRYAVIRPLATPMLRLFHSI